ncbi:hypothetical protein AA0119_g12595 [Alternaria tenuissima]|uniref:RNA polymerase II holoenzyme cyclin-like subunit n=1 Tax=Alternaria tenuissima TaxID=119927 RepID=A0A4Q4NYP0_9PLEO|nr:hypothetical protein AA0115_g4027 [Alternaria tenuissima]RYN55254.1 hypothetical protein AA0114_g3582 [Alternaria tenuissima]RYN87188.1 hypothetical protein AA0119_g12595 [Alternaria tenuissima]RYN96508.1 hypothetical protein AA0120_g3327 [Alternaria tenuissima]RYO23277.1 hypothetical protein AA0121_g2022 [Alternaria tenuissima]
MAPAASPLERDNERVGPHPSYIEVAKPYILQSRMQKCLSDIHMSDAKEDAVRLQGVAWIDQVRRALQLPIRTFNTAVIYYHKFRLLHADNEYNWADAAAAALFTACKIEDTLKKSREILCAHWNLKVGPGESLSSDDPRFENHSKLIIGLERLMLESAGFDFRNRYPQKVMVKLARALRFDAKDEAKTTWNLSIDSYRTFAPLKQSTPTLAIACLELAARLHGKDTTKFVDAGPVRYSKWATSRAEIMETLLDLLDLYTHHRSATSVGPSYTLEHFINIRIGLNQEASAANIPRYSRYKSESVADAGSTTNGAKPRNGIDPTSPFTPATPIAHSPAADQAPKSAIGIRGQNGTVRFMLDAARAHDERAEVEKFHKLEEEEYEVEVPISSESRTDDRERERARVGRDFISVANDEKSSAGIGHTEDYWNKFRKRSKVASDSEPASRTDGNVHTSRRAVKLDNVSDKGNVQRRADDHVNVSFDDGESNDRGRGRDSRKRPRLQDRKKRGDIYRSKITQHRESSSERLPPRLSMSSHGEADHERNFDYTGQFTPLDRSRGFDDRGHSGRRGGRIMRRGRKNHHRGSDCGSHEPGDTGFPPDDQYCTPSALKEAHVVVPRGENDVSRQSTAIRNSSKRREELQETTGFVLPDRMPVVSSAGELSSLAKPQASKERLPKRDVYKEQRSSANNTLSANDGHQWANIGDNYGNNRGRGRGRGRGRARGGRGGRWNNYRDGRGRGGGSGAWNSWPDRSLRSPRSP